MSSSMMMAWVGAAAGAVFSWSYWAPMIGFSEPFGRALISLGLANAGYAVGLSLEEKGAVKKVGMEVSLAALAVTLGGQYLLAPPLLAAIPQQWLAAILLGPVVAFVAGLLAAELMV